MLLQFKRGSTLIEVSNEANVLCVFKTGVTFVCSVETMSRAKSQHYERVFNQGMIENGKKNKR
jgi:hypothetical protein